MTAPLASRKDFEKTRKGQHQYWQTEMDAAQRRTRNWHKKGNNIVRHYVDDRESLPATLKNSKLNLFHSNVSLIQDMLFGKLPKVDVSRKYADPDDDTARVASEMAERVINLDIEDNGAEYESVLKAVLQDRLLPGLGCARVRYEMKTEEYDEEFEEEVFDEEMGQNITIKAKRPAERMAYECAPIDYFHWQDVLWGWSRTWAEIPWIAFRSYLTEDGAAARFGKRIAKKLVYETEKVAEEDTGEGSTEETRSNWQKAPVWEIWDKTNNKVCFYSPGAGELLEKPEDDPLKLEDFYPCPPFLLANPTTSLYLPTPDYKLAEDLYTEIDILQTRISLLTDAVKVVGVYDKSVEAIARVFDEAGEAELIPVENWAMFAEKGGVAGAVDFFPLDDVVAAMNRLVEQRDAQIELLYQITGMSDILRGGGTKERESATAQGLKAKFGSARLQGTQDAFAGFVANLMQIKLEVITKHFDAQTIIDQSNIMQTNDKDMADKAVALIKSPGKMKLRVSIEAEALAMVDFAQKKQDRVEYLNALTTYMGSAAKMMQIDPSARPYILKMLQWGLAGFKGAQQIEGVLDDAIEAALQNPMKQEGDDNAKQQAEQAKQQFEMQKLQMQQQLEQQKHQFKMNELQAKNQGEMMKIMESLKASISVIQAKLEADVAEEEQQSNINAEQGAIATENEMTRDAMNHEQDLEEQELEHEYTMDEIAAQHRSKDSDDD